MADATLLIEVKADPRQAQVLNSALDSLAGKGAKATAEAVRLTNAFTKASEATAKVNIAITKEKVALEGLAQAEQKTAEGAAKAALAQKKLGDAAESAGKSAKKSQKDFTDMFASLLNARTGVDGLIGGMLRLGTGAYLTVRGLQTIANLLKAVPNAFLTAAGAAEKAQIQLAALTGSIENGSVAYTKLLALSRQSGLGTQTAMDTMTRMRGFGVATENLIPLMQKLTIATRGDSDAMQRLGLVYGQVTQQGRTYGDDLRQIYNTGVPLAKAMADVLGISVSELREAGKEGKITADVMDKALTMITAHGSALGNAWETGMDSAISKTKQLKETWDQLLATTGSGVLEFYKPAISFFQKTAQDLNDAAAFNLAMGKLKDRGKLPLNEALTGVDVASAVRGGQARLGAAMNSRAGNVAVQNVANDLALLVKAMEEQNRIAAKKAAEDAALNGPQRGTWQEFRDSTNKAIEKKIADTYAASAYVAAKATPQNAASIAAMAEADQAIAEFILEQFVELRDKDPALFDRLVDSKEGSLARKKRVAYPDDEFRYELAPGGQKDKTLQDLLNWYSQFAKDPKGLAGKSPSKTVQELYEDAALAYRKSIAGEFASAELDPKYDDKMYEAYATFIKAVEDAIISTGADPSVAARLRAARLLLAEDLNAATQPDGKADYYDGPEGWMVVPRSNRPTARERKEERLLRGDANPQAAQSIYNGVGMGPLGFRSAEMAAANDPLMQTGIPKYGGASLFGTDFTQQTLSAADAVNSLDQSLQSLAMSSAVDTLTAAGTAFGEALMSMEFTGEGAYEYLDGLMAKLPPLFIEAGLRLIIADPKNPMGWALLAAGGFGAISNGIVNSFEANGNSGSPSPDVTMNAMGNAYQSASLSSYSGGIYNSPRLFRFANGAGMFGEAGPEAIMPLTRTSTGKLGVASSGGSNVTVQIIDQSSGRVGITQTESTGADGSKVIRATIRDLMRAEIASGNMNGALQGAAVRQAGRRRI